MRPGVLGLLIALYGAPPVHAQRPAYYFLELGGAGGLASVNLEVNPVAGLRARGGAGLFLWPSLPLMASYTLGSRRHSLEIGAGTTLIMFPASHPTDADRRDLFSWGEGDGTLLIGTAALGYRYVSAGGTLFRVTVTPLFGHGDAVMWFGLSLGHAF